MSVTDGESVVGTPLTQFLVQLLIIVILSRLLASLLKYIKQPSVIAEVITGILLGPSALGIVTSYKDKIFPATSLPTFGVIANIGLILFMFMVGLELDVRIMKHNVIHALVISISAMVTPFLLGLISAYVIHKVAIDPSVSFTHFLLFVAVAMSITAFPFLARILTELKLMHTKVGSLALSAAAVDDVVAWCLLALVVAISRAHSPLSALYTFLLLIAFILIMFLLVRPLLGSIVKRKRVRNSQVPFPLVFGLLISIFLCAWFTEIIGVHAIFGSFILGVIVPRENQFAKYFIERIEDIVVIVFLPLYFTFSGLRTNVGSLNDGVSWGLVILVITIACVGKITGGTISARLLKNSWRDSFAIGILMNTKGLVEVIVLNIGLDVGVLNTKVFTIFIIMALVTTFMTTPIIHFFYLKRSKKEKELKEESLSCLLVLRHESSSLPLGHLSKIFSLQKPAFNLKALLLLEISDRPSSYFMSEFSGVFSNINISGKNKRKNLLEGVKRATDVPGVEAKISVLSSASVTKDFINYLSNRSLDVILFHVSSGSSPSTPAEDRNRTLERISSTFAQVVDRMFSAELGLINNALTTVSRTIGVLVTKKDLLSLQKVLILDVSPSSHSTPSSFSAFLKTLIDKMPSDLELTIFQKKAESSTEDPKEKHEKEEEEKPKSSASSSGSDAHIKFMSPENPIEEALEESKHFDLVIIASPREMEIFNSPFLAKVECSVLVLFPGTIPKDKSAEFTYADRLI